MQEKHKGSSNWATVIVMSCRAALHLGLDVCSSIETFTQGSCLMCPARVKLLVTAAKLQQCWVLPLLLFTCAGTCHHNLPIVSCDRNTTTSTPTPSLVTD